MYLKENKESNFVTAHTPSFCLVLQTPDRSPAKDVHLEPCTDDSERPLWPTGLADTGCHPFHVQTQPCQLLPEGHKATEDPYNTSQHLPTTLGFLEIL